MDFLAVTVQILIFLLFRKNFSNAVTATGKPVIVVLTNGGALSVNKAQEKAAAIILAGYGGQQGGNAVADVLFGDYNPAGQTSCNIL